LYTDLALPSGAAPEISLKVRLWKNPEGKDHRDWEGSVGTTPSSIAADPYDLSFAVTQGVGLNVADRVAHISLCPALKSEHVLMRFEAAPPKSLPFRGFYQMKPVSAKEAKLLLQVKLNDRLCNNFEYCRVVLPFQNVGQIESFEVSPTEGTVTLLENCLVWDLGTSIAGRKLECALPMSVKFVNSIVMMNAGSTSPSCYADIDFKMIGCSIAGVRVDSTDVTIYPKPASGVSMIPTYTLKSKTFRIWNSLGETVRQVQPPTLF
jgi:hypothetical protein